MEKLETFQGAVARVQEQLKELMIKKQIDYGHKNITEFGEYGVLVRVNDKIARLKNLMKNPGDIIPENESIDDTWMDIANYAIIVLMLRQGIFELPLVQFMGAPSTNEHTRSTQDL